jgi:hypothetical protein
MLKYLTLLSLAATFSAANAQAADPSVQTPSVQTPSDQSQPAAPIVRSYAQHRPWRGAERITESQPTPGVWLRAESTSGVTTVSAAAQRTEIRLERGRLNVSVHQPAQHSEILIDLPGGQTSLLKDGLYTFNADTDTVRVLRGEAAYVGPTGAGTNAAKPIKIKEDHELSLVAAGNGKAGEGKAGEGKAGEGKAVEAYPWEMTADLLPLGDGADRGYGGGGGYLEGDYPPYGPYPYYAGAWGYPYGYGFYPGFYGYPVAYGIGFGYYGGFAYRGGFRR